MYLTDVKIMGTASIATVGIATVGIATVGIATVGIATVGIATVGIATEHFHTTIQTKKIKATILEYALRLSP